MMRMRRALILTKGDGWDFDVSVMHDATIQIERGVGNLPACIWDIIIDCAINQHGEYLSAWKRAIFLSGVKDGFGGERKNRRKRVDRTHWHKRGWGVNKSQDGE